jgi:hypothetical protein
VLSAGGEKFGKYETPLTITSFDGKHFDLSGPALSDKLRPISQLAASLDTALLEDQTPLVFKGVEMVPSPSNRFQKGEAVGCYVEVYEPAMQNSRVPRVGVLYNIVNRKTNQQVFSSNTIPLDDVAQAGNPLIPAAVPIPMDKLQAGDYRVEVRARDSDGGVTPVRAADFVVE